MKNSNDDSIQMGNQRKGRKVFNDRRPLTKPFVDVSTRNNVQTDSGNNLAAISQQAVSTDETRKLQKVFVDRPTKVSNDTPAPVSQQYLQSDPIPQSVSEDTLANMPKGTIKAFVDKPESNNTPALEDSQNKHLAKIPQKEVPHTEKKVYAIDVAAELAKYFNFVKFEDEVYFFNREHNHYQKCPPKTLKKIVYDIYKNSPLKKKGINFFNTVCKYLSLEAESPRYLKEDFFDVKNYIGFKNGYLNINSAKFHPLNPDKFITNYLEVNYEQQYVLKLLHEKTDLRSIHCSNFDDFIWRMADGNHDIFSRIFEMIGYIVTNDTSAKKLFVLGRAKDSGKSQLCKFISSLFNEDAVTTIPLGELGDKFTAVALQGKALCIDADLPACKIRNKTAAAIKAYTGNDLISSDVKFQDRKKFNTPAKFVFATNHLIEIDPREDALKERFIYIPIINTIPPEERIFDIIKLFEPEKFKIIMKSIRFYLELRENQYQFTGNFPLDDIVYCENPVSVVISEMKKNTVENFVRQRCLITNFEQYTPTDVLYNAYCDFYNGDKTYIVDYNHFSKLLNKICASTVEKIKKRIDGYESPISVYKGIVLN